MKEFLIGLVTKSHSWNQLANQEEKDALTAWGSVDAKIVIIHEICFHLKRK